MFTPYLSISALLHPAPSKHDLLSPRASLGGSIFLARDSGLSWENSSETMVRALIPSVAHYPLKFIKAPFENSP